MSLRLLPERTVSSSVISSPSSVAAVTPVSLLVSSGIVHIASLRSPVLNIDHCIIFVGEGCVLVRVVVRLHVGPVWIEARDIVIVAVESLRGAVPYVGRGVGVAHHRAAFVQVVGVAVVVHRSSVLRVLLV